MTCIYTLQEKIVIIIIIIIIINSYKTLIIKQLHTSRLDIAAAIYNV